MSSSRRPGKSWPTRTTRSPPRTPTPAACTCARSSRCGSSDRRTSTAPWARWNARSGSTSRTARSARELERVGGQYDRWDRVVEIYLGAIDEFGPIDTAVALHHDAARLRERLGQTDKAEALYDEILRLKSDDEVALARVEEIFRDQQRWEDLANVLEKRTSAPTEALPLGPERRKRLRELATLYEERLERPYEAIDTLERLLIEVADEERSHGEAATPAENAEMIGAHEALVRLYSRVGLWGKVVDSLKRQAELTTDRQQARALRLQIAGVYEKELAVPERATEAYEAILASDPDDEEALAALDRLNEVHSRFEDLQEILAKRAAHATGKERIDLVRRRAKLLEDKLNNPEAAASALRELGHRRRSPTTRCWRRCCATCAAPAWPTRPRARCRSGSRSSAPAAAPTAASASPS